MTFEVTPGWLAFHPNPSIPSFKLPPGAVDAHCHVFGPGDRFPYAPERKYTPCDASKEQLFALRDRLGFTKNVVVQATCHGADNRALLDALKHSDNRRRAWCALQLRQAARGLHAEGRVDGNRRAHRAARLARGDLLRGGGPARAV